MSLLASEIYVGAKSLERDLALLELFGASYIGTCKRPPRRMRIPLTSLLAMTFSMVCFMTRRNGRRFSRASAIIMPGDSGIGLGATNFLYV